MSLLSHLNIALSLNGSHVLVLLILIQVLVHYFLHDLFVFLKFPLFLDLHCLCLGLILFLELSFKLVIRVKDVLLVVHDAIGVNGLFNAVVLVVTDVVSLGLIIVGVHGDRGLVKLPDLSQINFSQEQSYHET